MGIEGGHSIEDSIGLLREYYRLGARYMTLTWANSNGWADSSGDTDDPNVKHTEDGLADFGRGRRLRDESPGHDGGHLARCRPDLLARHYFAGAGIRLALFGASA